MDAVNSTLYRLYARARVKKERLEIPIDVPRFPALPRTVNLRTNNVPKMTRKVQKLHQMTHETLSAGSLFTASRKVCISVCV